MGGYMLYFIVNEKSKSGDAKQIWKEIEEVLKVRNVPIRHLYRSTVDMPVNSLQRSVPWMTMISAWSQSVGMERQMR